MPGRWWQHDAGQPGARRTVGPGCRRGGPHARGRSRPRAHGAGSIAPARAERTQSTSSDLAATPRRPIWRRILAQFQDPLIYLLLAAVVIALVAWVIEGRTGWPVDAIVIAAVVLLNGVLGHVQETKAENAVAALAKMTATTSAVLRDGKPQRGPAA